MKLATTRTLISNALNEAVIKQTSNGVVSRPITSNAPMTVDTGTPSMGTNNQRELSGGRGSMETPKVQRTQASKGTPKISGGQVTTAPKTIGPVITPATPRILNADTITNEEVIDLTSESDDRSTSALPR